MMGIMCEDPIFVYGENKSVLANTIVTSYTLKKNMNSLSYHFFVKDVHRMNNVQYMSTRT